MADTKNSKSKRIFLFLRIAVVVCGIGWGIWWVSRGERWGNLRGIFLQINAAVFAAALGIFVAGQIIVGLRWWLLLRTQSIFIGFWTAVRLHFLGLFYNNFMPSSVGGDLIRAWYVTRHTEKRFEAALSVFVDRVIGLLSTLIIAIFFYSVFLRGRGLTGQITTGRESGFIGSFAEHKTILLLLFAITAVMLFGLLVHRQGRKLLRKIAAKIGVFSIDIMVRFKNAAVIYCSRPLVILAAFGLTVLLQMTTITGFWLLGSNMGIEVSVKYYYVFFTMTWVFGAVPVSIGGAVVVESLLAYMFIHFAGVSPEAALAIALCQRAVWMLTSLPGALIHLTGGHLPGESQSLHAPKNFSVDYKKSNN